MNCGICNHFGDCQAWIETAIIHLSLSALIILSDITTTAATAAAAIGMVFQPPALPVTLYQKHLVGWESSWPVQQCENNNISSNVRQSNMKTTRILIEECMCLEGVYQIITPTSVKMSVQHNKCYQTGLWDCDLIRSWGRSSGMLADFMSLTDLWTPKMKGAQRVL